MLEALLKLLITLKYSPASGFGETVIKWNNNKIVSVSIKNDILIK